jgi:hypothetical protein
MLPELGISEVSSLRVMTRGCCTSIPRAGRRSLLAHYILSMAAVWLSCSPSCFSDAPNEFSFLVPMGDPTPHLISAPTFTIYDDLDSNAPEQEFMQRPNIVSFKGQPEQLDEANHRLRIDAINADQVMARAMLDLKILFDITVPPIFNVCPHSSHSLFPRIDCGTAMSMLRGQS